MRSLTVDLLHQDPLPFHGLPRLREALRFSFEGGDAAGIFERLLEDVPLQPTAWNPSLFAPHLFLDELLDHVLRAGADGGFGLSMRRFVLQAISCPPTEPRDTEFRHELLRELHTVPERRAAFDDLARALRTLRDRLESLSSGQDDTVRRKIDILAAYLEVLEILGRFDGASSGLSRLHELGSRVNGSEDHGRLRHFLEFERNLAVVDVSLRLGSDGRIRGFDIVSMNERGANQLRPSRWTRFWRRVISWLSGYRYTESEVVIRLIDSVFAPLEPHLAACLALSGPVEFYSAFLSFSDRAREVGLDVSLPTFAVGERRREFEGLFNPLLLLQPDLRIRSVDLASAPYDQVTVLTGPNSGGKTRLLQAVALVQLFGQVGGFVPARTARLTWAPKLFLSLVDDHSASESEGRLGSELRRVRQLFEQLEPGSLAILDELCSGTNPVEGEAIFSLVLELLPALHPQVFISTHFLSLAGRLAACPPFERLAFLQVELDGDERPTFGFVPGVAETSLAHRVASRLGVTRGELEALVAAKSAGR